jgi:hypothetical protein
MKSLDNSKPRGKNVNVTLPLRTNIIYLAKFFALGKRNNAYVYIPFKHCSGDNKQNKWVNVTCVTSTSNRFPKFPQNFCALPQINTVG